MGVVMCVWEQLAWMLYNCETEEHKTARAQDLF
jgi:hypothetical protein